MLRARLDNISLMHRTAAVAATQGPAVVAAAATSLLMGVWTIHLGVVLAQFAIPLLHQARARDRARYRARDRARHRARYRARYRARDQARYRARDRASVKDRARYRARDRASVKDRARASAKDRVRASAKDRVRDHARANAKDRAKAKDRVRANAKDRASLVVVGEEMSGLRNKMNQTLINLQVNQFPQRMMEIRT